ncbi:MAG TPA: PaaI family thioesterase [Methylomirabilota bacterium]|nr:PaaI family thioesterase [Methylomirabilota bacterium]
MSLAATAPELAALLTEIPVAREHGFRLVEVADGACTVEVPFAPALERPGGVVAGPAFMAAADVTMWFAILTRLGTADESVTAHLDTTFVAAARREGFRCTARVLKLGSRLIHGVAECVAADGRLLTHHTITYARAGPPSF